MINIQNLLIKVMLIKSIETCTKEQITYNKHSFTRFLNAIIIAMFK